jgi:hypothetical protein
MAARATVSVPATMPPGSSCFNTKRGAAYAARVVTSDEEVRAVGGWRRELGTS